MLKLLSLCTDLDLRVRAYIPETHQEIMLLVPPDPLLNCDSYHERYTEYVMAAHENIY